MRVDALPQATPVVDLHRGGRDPNFLKDGPDSSHEPVDLGATPALFSQGQGAARGSDQGAGLKD